MMSAGTFDESEKLKLEDILIPNDCDVFKRCASDAFTERSTREGIYEITLHKWYLFNSLIFTMRNMSHAIYRGVSNPEYTLMPSLFRMSHMWKEDEDPLNKVERCLEHFRMAMRGRRSLGARHDLSINEVWALGRHYGLPTPILDWTYSPYVALFFAVAEPSDAEMRTVYCLHKKKIDDYRQNENKSYSPPEKDKGISLSQEKSFDSLTFYSPHTDENPRLIAQAGLFTVCHELMSVEDWVKSNCSRIEDNLKEKGGIYRRIPARGDWILMKVNINVNPSPDRTRILRLLNRMNINYATLFPDLEGAAKYTKMELSIKHY